jgi:ADP-ribosyl-[dinitrogen reductase] hydrolase
MLLEIAIADAYGAGFEYADPTDDRPNDASGYARHPRRHTIEPGMFTDDTQGACAIVECLLAGKITKPDFAEAIVRAYKRDPREGYARGFHALLQEVKDGVELLDRIRPDSEKSGAAMRAGPIGLLGSIEEVLHVAAEQARITHDTPGGVGAAQGAALMIHHQAYGLGAVSELPEFLAKHVPNVDWRRPNRSRTGSKGEEIARTALAVLLDSGGLREVLLRAVAIGGDTDTVAVIAMAAASVSPTFERDLPNGLIEALEDGAFGRTYIAGLDAQLSAAFDLPILTAGLNDFSERSQ